MKMRGMVNYQLHIWLSGGKWVAPLVLLCAFLYGMYSFGPLDVESGFILSSTFVYLLMSWIAMMMTQADGEIFEFPIFLRFQKTWQYYLGKIAPLLAVGLGVAVLSVVFPFLADIVDRGLFIRPLRMADMVNAFLLLHGATVCGAAAGSFFHPVYMKNRKWRVLCTILACVLAVAKSGIINEIPWSRLFLWVVPPAMLASEHYGNGEQFHIGTSLFIWLVYAVYGFALFAIRSFVCYKKRF